MTKPPCLDGYRTFHWKSLWQQGNMNIKLKFEIRVCTHSSRHFREFHRMGNCLSVGAYGPQGIKLVNQIGKKIQDATGEKLSTFYLFQRISIAIQKGNAKCITDCVKDRSSGLEGLFNFHVQEAEEL